jgi:hypothetical protein
MPNQRMQRTLPLTREPLAGAGSVFDLERWTVFRVALAPFVQSRRFAPTQPKRSDCSGTTDYSPSEQAIFFRRNAQEDETCTEIMNDTSVVRR